MLLFLYDAPEQLEQLVTALFDSLTLQLESGAEGTRGGEGGTGLSDWFKRSCQASGHHAGLMGAVCSRRTRGPLAAPHAVLLNNALIQVRARLLLSVAERWALLFRKARGLQRSRPQVPLQEASAPAGLAPPAARVNHGLGPGVADA